MKILQDDPQGVRAASLAFADRTDHILRQAVARGASDEEAARQALFALDEELHPVQMPSEVRRDAMALFAKIAGMLRSSDIVPRKRTLS